MTEFSASADAVCAPKRILLAGTSGTGKSTWAQRIGHALNVPYVELDALFHGPNWVPRPEFEAEVRDLAAQERWVTEWQYDTARPVLLDRATTLIWLDLPVSRAMWQLTRRTVWRRIRHEKLWGGNEEMPLWKILVEPNHMIRWSWRTRHSTRNRVLEVCKTHPQITVVRCRSHRDVAEWLQAQQ